ncbi:MAG: hypothetical protein ACI4OU_03345 [Candidatus Enterenecus sp.]
MEDRKRTILAVLVALIVVVALLYSFGLNLFYRAPQLDLADPGAVESREPGGADLAAEAGIVVEVTPATVQSVVASLSRYESYSRTVTVTYGWGGGETAAATVRVWADGGWVRTDTTLSSGLVECSILGDGRLWLWYEDGEENSRPQVYEGPAAELSADLMQHLPTYEDVLDLDPAEITGAGYEEREGHPCIYIQAERRELGYTCRYWVSVTNGLLMAAETVEDGALIYTMRSNQIISPLTDKAENFTLPDGTVLYGAG